MRSIAMLARHLLAILVLPVVMVAVIPHMLVEESPPPTPWTGRGAHDIAIGIVAAIVFAAGFLLFAWCLTLFASKGKGTLAPWDPPRHLVVSGPYLHVRNPMISGVIAMISGEAIYHESAALGLWALAFFLINQVYFRLIEEPGLERRFGEEYRRYKAAVPRWIPRIRAWEGMKP